MLNQKTTIAPPKVTGLEQFFPTYSNTLGNGSDNRKGKSARITVGSATKSKHPSLFCVTEAIVNSGRTETNHPLSLK